MKIFEQKNYKTLVAIGLIGTLLIGFGDWLLGCVTPTVVGNSFYIRTGHGENYGLWRPVVSMIVAIAGMPFYMSFFYGISNTFTHKRTKKIFVVCSVFALFCWLIIHYYVSSFIYQYAWGIQNNVEGTYTYATEVSLAFLPLIILCVFFAGLPFIIHFITTLRGTTCLPKWAVLFNAIPCAAYIFVVMLLLPTSHFNEGLRMAIVHEACFLWGLGIILYRKKNIS